MTSSSQQVSRGQTATLTLRFSQGDFDRFAALSGDDNPIHVDPQFAARSLFGRTVAHGMLLYSTISRVLNTQLPGPGTLQLQQEMIFPSPTYADEEITVRVTLVKNRAPGLAELTFDITRPSGELSCEGRTLVILPGSDIVAVGLDPEVKSGHESEAREYKRLKVGQSASLTRTFSPDDLREYVDLTGDASPLYTDTKAAKKRGLAETPVPGVMLGGLFSCLLGTRLPGTGTNWLKQKMRFLSPAYPGDPITARVGIVRLRPGKDLANLRTTCTCADGRLVCEGEALVRIKDLA